MHARSIYIVLNTDKDVIRGDNLIASFEEKKIKQTTLRKRKELMHSSFSENFTETKHREIMTSLKHCRFHVPQYGQLFLQNLYSQNPRKKYPTQNIEFAI